MKFQIVEGVVAALDLRGLEAPPDAEGFSRDALKSYFAHGGMDVSLVWIGADLHARMMRGHRENFEAPRQVTVARIGEARLGGVSVTEVIYAKGCPVVAPDDTERIVQGREVTWQYSWPGDAGGSHALLTIWRSGLDDIAVLKNGLAAMRDRWQAGAPLKGLLYDLRGAVEDERLVLTGVAVVAPDLPWGRVRVPVFHEYRGWAVEVFSWDGGAVAVRGPLMLRVPGTEQAEGLKAELSVVESWLARWGALLARLCTHAEAAGQAFVAAVRTETDEVDTGDPVLVDAAMDAAGAALELRIALVRGGETAHEGTVSVDADGRMISTELDC